MSLITIVAVLFVALLCQGVFAQSIEVVKVEGDVKVKLNNGDVQSVAENDQLSPNWIIRTASDARVALRIGGEVLVIPGGITIPLQRIANERNLQSLSRLMAVRSTNQTAYHSSSITSVAGVRGSLVTSATDASHDVMLDEGDIDSRALLAIQKAQEYVTTNQLDMVLQTLEPYKEYNGVYAPVIAKTLGNLYFDQGNFMEAMPLLQRALASENLSEEAHAALQYRYIVCLIDHDDLVTALNEIDSWLEQFEGNTELAPLVLNYKVVLQDYLQKTDEAKETLQHLKATYPEHQVTAELSAIYAEWESRFRNNIWMNMLLRNE